ncbi:MAG: hypothetical protein ACRD5M_12180 [Candidatus Acidiferrales bacterium]
MSHSRPPALKLQLCLYLMKILCLLVFLPGLVWADGAHPDPGHLQQTVLVILHFPPQGVAGELSAADETYINSELSVVSNFFWTNSNQSLQVNFETIKILQSVVASDYEQYGQTGCAAKYDAAEHHSLANRLVDPRQYAGVIMIYRPTNATCSLFYNTWIYFNDQLSGPKLNPGFSSIIYTYNSQPPLSQFIEHEYCHQLHHRFEYEAHDSTPALGGLAPDGFIDSDWMTTPGGPSNQLSTIAQDLGLLLGTTFQPGNDVPWLEAIVKYYVGAPDRKHPNGTLHAVNYRWLQGRYRDNVVLGVFDGGELRNTYNFAQSDDVLVHVSGDNITAVRADGSPPSFWFRAEPGHTAAFGTQTGFGLYLLKQVAFNYEIAPDDYTFQVHLVYYDVYNHPVDVRIDDGIFSLGRQEFANNRKVITLPAPLEVEDFQIVFQKSNQLSGAAANDDWALIGNISLDTSLAP